MQVYIVHLTMMSKTALVVRLHLVSLKLELGTYVCTYNIMLYTNMVLILIEFQGCLADTVQDIWWPDTARNTLARQKCPGGANSIG